MSEEKDDGDCFVRRVPSWRSNAFNRYIAKLDKRHQSKNPKSIARKRSFGSVVEKPPSKNAASWMIEQGESVWTD